MKSFLLCLCSVFLFSVNAHSLEAPAQIEREGVLSWYESIDSNVSPYYDYVFDWLEEQRETDQLPNEVYQDPEKIFVRVDRVLAVTIELEDVGEVERAITYGLETFMEIDAPVETVLETMLFRWGKPVGAAEGKTFPYDFVYGFRREALTREFGENTYKTFTIKTNGGIAKDQNDSFTLMVRSDEKGGYELLGSFFAPMERTSTSSFFTLMKMQPMGPNKTAFRVTGMHTGQSYGFLGIEYGRKNFGFNLLKIREGQKEFLGQVYHLRDKGWIPERRPNSMFF
ncbi:MAG: hypothetical protein M9962_01305 [Oligoflexia bacterium]|nr:hypothetical protein [Oligoflexia bacterium]